MVMFIMNYNQVATWSVKDCYVRACTLSSMLAQDQDWGIP